MSDTPRTDAREQRVAGPNAWDPQDTVAVHSDFARELERQNGRYGRALDNISAMANRLHSHIYGGRMGKPQDRTEMVLLDIVAAAHAALNGEENPR